MESGEAALLLPINTHTALATQRSIAASHANITRLTCCFHSSTSATHDVVNTVPFTTHRLLR